MVVGNIGVDIILKTVGDVDIRVDNNELIGGHIFEEENGESIEKNEADNFKLGFGNPISLIIKYLLKLGAELLLISVSGILVFFILVPVQICHLLHLELFHLRLVIRGKELVVNCISPN